MIKKIKAISVRLRGIVKGNGSRGIERERAGEVEDIFGYKNLIASYTHLYWGEMDVMSLFGGA